MKTPFQWLKSRWLRDCCGATAIEYSLIVGGIAVVIASAVFLLGSDLQGLFNSIGPVLSGGG